MSKYKNFDHKQANAQKVEIQAYNALPEKNTAFGLTKKIVRGFSYAVKPNTYNDFFVVPHVDSIAIIPTYKPTSTVVALVEDILKYNYKTKVILVNDNSPAEYDSIVERVKLMSADRVTVLKTADNKLKAGAINLALRYITDKNLNPQVVYTMDDDVKIDALTLGTMASELLRDEVIGAVCSQARVLNKNKNLLTRFQGLEYHGYNVIRIAESGFIRGPLVMHGMLTAFRYEAIVQAGQFAEGHLIEDYEMTVRLKKNKWHVKFATEANAWTEVPETFVALWKQRVRWSVGGMALVSKERYLPAIFQDVIGHVLFLITFFTIILGFMLSGNTSNPLLTLIIASSALIQSLISYIFYVGTLGSYEDKDWVDVLFRVLILPEFIYANILSLVLFGTYIFYIYTTLVQKLLSLTTFSRKYETYINRLFLNIGFSQGWGTK
ncbi:MAG: glycosyltransferase family 2 protein [bacterium]|nr:glycosyltransferase family 2 protein [bacterium]